jgi:hypothetical protein
VRSLAVMRHVKIIERPNKTYPFAAIDQQTGEIPLRLTERGDLVALWDEWKDKATGEVLKSSTMAALAISVAVSGGSMGKSRQPQIILKTDQRNVILEWGLGRKLQAKSSGRDENRTFLEGAVLEVAVRNGRWVLTHVPAGPRPARPPTQHYFPTEE